VTTRPWFPYLGILAVLLYLAAVVVGAALYPGYSHLRDTISSLTNPTAPHLRLLNILFAVYNLAVLAFGIGWAARSLSATARASAILVAITGLLGLVLYFFPQDPMGSEITRVGVIHVAIAGLLSLLTMAAVLTRGIAERAAPGLKGRSIYSFISVAVVFVTGGLAAAGVAQGWAFAGLLERLTIGTFLQWLAVESILAR
jgi:hypothetical membrane protein